MPKPQRHKVPADWLPSPSSSHIQVQGAACTSCYEITRQLVVGLEAQTVSGHAHQNCNARSTCP